MAIFGISENKKKKVQKETRKKAGAKTSGAIETAKEQPSREEKKTPVARIAAKNLGKYYRVLKNPHITEKATDLTKENQYVFTVWDNVNKQDAKKAVEDIYGVKVVKINIIRIPGKEKRIGKTMGWKQGYKKAIVKLQEGQKIEVLPR